MESLLGGNYYCADCSKQLGDSNSTFVFIEHPQHLPKTCTKCGILMRELPAYELLAEEIARGAGLSKAARNG